MPDDLYDLRPIEPPATGGGYRVRSEETWAAARDAYLDGEAAEAVCDRFDLSLGAFRSRAQRGGWRRCDQADPAPLAPTADDTLEEDADYARMADHALIQLRRAMARGRISAAAGWMRLHDRLSARAEDEAKRAEAALTATLPPPPRSVEMEQLRETIEARRQAAETYVARRQLEADRTLARLQAQLHGDPISDDSDDSDPVFEPAGLAPAWAPDDRDQIADDAPPPPR